MGKSIRKARRQRQQRRGDVEERDWGGGRRVGDEGGEKIDHESYGGISETQAQAQKNHKFGGESESQTQKDHKFGGESESQEQKDHKFGGESESQAQRDGCAKGGKKGKFPAIDVDQDFIICQECYSRSTNVLRRDRGSVKKSHWRWAGKEKAGGKRVFCGRFVELTCVQAIEKGEIINAKGFGGRQ